MTIGCHQKSIWDLTAFHLDTSLMFTVRWETEKLRVTNWIYYYTINNLGRQGTSRGLRSSL